MRACWWRSLKIWATPVVLLLLAAATPPPNPVNGSGSPAARAGQLQQIHTKTTFRNGSTLINTGQGFVLGDLFFTVHHNLDPGYRVKNYNTQSYLADLPVQAIAVDASNDLAVIRIPQALCPSWCNRLSIPDASSIGLQQQVEWLTKGANPTRWQQASVLSITKPNSIRTNPTASTACQLGLVVEVTHPFMPGTSGTAVWDTLTHELLGMAQGSYERVNGKTSGYFKPFACIIEHLQAHGLSNIVSSG